MKFIILFCVTISAYGQFEDQNSLNIFMDIRPFMSLEVTVGSGDLNYRFSSFEDINLGITKPNAFLVKIKSNQNWQLNVSSLNSHFINSQNGQQSNLPSHSLRLRKGTGSFIPLSPV